tara:strand:- start:2305 stop:3069 length:765 start_codon:yes stop_codon:yes gene_type:complete
VNNDIIEEFSVIEELSKTSLKNIMIKYLYGCKIYQHCNFVLNDTNRKIVKECLRQLLGDVHDLFVYYNIRYLICSGTLLGAVRDGQFIDGDDDIDIRIHKEDWDMCVKILSYLGRNYDIYKKHDKWYQVNCKVKTPGDPIHLDIVSSDLELEHGDWPNVDYLFYKPLDLIMINDMMVYGPNKDDIVPYLEMNYGKKWNVKKCYNFKYRKYIILVNVFFILLVCLFIFLSIRKTPFFVIPIVIFLLMVIISLVNN